MYNQNLDGHRASSSSLPGVPMQVLYLAMGQLGVQARDGGLLFKGVPSVSARPLHGQVQA